MYLKTHLLTKRFNMKINLYAGPGTGKSTVQSLLYGLLKTNHYSVEMVREYAKDLVYNGINLKNSDLETQLIIFAEQLNREKLLEKAGIDVIITDSPLLLNAFYAKDQFFVNMALNNTNDNDLHIWLERNKDEYFEKDGRCHSEKESKEIDVKLQEFLLNNNIKLIHISGESIDKAQKIKDLLDKEDKHE